MVVNAADISLLLVGDVCDGGDELNWSIGWFLLVVSDGIAEVSLVGVASLVPTDIGTDDVVDGGADSG